MTNTESWNECNFSLKSPIILFSHTHTQLKQQCHTARKDGKLVTRRVFLAVGRLNIRLLTPSWTLREALVDGVWPRRLAKGKKRETETGRHAQVEGDLLGEKVAEKGVGQLPDRGVGRRGALRERYPRYS